MFSSMKNFINRHKKKCIVGGLLVGGVVLATKYSKKKILEWQEQESKDFLERARKEHHFLSTERTCNQTISSLAQTLKDTVMEIIDTETLLKKIRSGEGNKVEQWNTIKVLVFAQLSSLLYSGLMLVIVLRIQLNVIGGYMFREKIDSQTHDLFSSSFQEHYLSLCHYFLNKGVKNICNLMETHTRLVLENVSLKQKMSLEDLENIFWATQSSLNNDPNDPLKNLSKYLLPPVFNNTDYKGVDSKKMKQIVEETFEILDSEEVKSIAESCIKRAYSNVTDKLASSYYNSLLVVNPSYLETSNKVIESNYQNITTLSIPLAKVIPVIYGLFNESSENGDALTSWIYPFLIMDNIKLLGANLYDAFSH